MWSLPAARGEDERHAFDDRLRNWESTERPPVREKSVLLRGDKGGIEIVPVHSPFTADTEKKCSIATLCEKVLRAKRVQEFGEHCRGQSLKGTRLTQGSPCLFCLDASGLCNEGENLLNEG